MVPAPVGRTVAHPVANDRRGPGIELRDDDITPTAGGNVMPIVVEHLDEVRLGEGSVDPVARPRGTQRARVGRGVERGEPDSGKAGPQPAGVRVGQRRPAVHEEHRTQHGVGSRDPEEEPGRS